jgi:hypothetical protein
MHDTHPHSSHSHSHSHSNSHSNSNEHDHEGDRSSRHGQPHRHHDAAETRSHHVMLDLGEGVGALIVQTGTELLGVEVEISPAGADDSRQHKQVLLRTMGALQVPTLVYDNLEEGDYTLWIDGVATARGVRVSGGAIAELDWRSSPVAVEKG